MEQKTDIGLQIKKISDKLGARADAELKKNGITSSQLQVISYLIECGGSATQKAIGKHLSVAHPTVVGLVSRLEKSGFVESRTDENDRRNKIVCVTQKGLGLRDEIYKGRRRTENLLHSRFTDDEIRQLVTLLKKMYEGLENS